MVNFEPDGHLLLHETCDYQSLLAMENVYNFLAYGKSFYSIAIFF